MKFFKFTCILSVEDIQMLKYQKLKLENYISSIKVCRKKFT